MPKNQKSSEGFMKSVKKFSQRQKDLAGQTLTGFHLAATGDKGDRDHPSPLSFRTGAQGYRPEGCCYSKNSDFVHKTKAYSQWDSHLHIVEEPVTCLDNNSFLS